MYCVRKFLSATFYYPPQFCMAHQLEAREESSTYVTALELWPVLCCIGRSDVVQASTTLGPQIVNRWRDRKL